jgi:hypothetical protein
MKIIITVSVRRELIRKSREVIKERKRKARSFFRTGKTVFKQAVAQYRHH